MFCNDTFMTSEPQYVTSLDVYHEDCGSCRIWIARVRAKAQRGASETSTTEDDSDW